MEKNIIDFLKKLDFNDKQSRIYLTSLKYGAQPASILAKHVKIPRPTVYHELNKMVDMGIFTQKYISKIAVYSAVPPQMLEYIIEAKLANAKNLLVGLHKILPEFEKIQRDAFAYSEVSFFKGVEGLCRMLDDFADKDQTVRYISAYSIMDKDIEEYIINHYIPKSKLHKNKNKIILKRSKSAKKFEELTKDAYEDFIYLPDEKYQFQTTTAIYDDKVAFLSYNPNDLSGVIIKNSRINNDLRIIFEFMEKQFSED